MKNTSDSMAVLGTLIYAVLILGSILFIILGLDEFAKFILPLLNESVNQI